MVMHEADAGHHFAQGQAVGFLINRTKGAVKDMPAFPWRKPRLQDNPGKTLASPQWLRSRPVVLHCTQVTQKPLHLGSAAANPPGPPPRSDDAC